MAQLSFLGWYLLSIATFGLSAIFYSNGYNAAFFAEYYVKLRATAKSAGSRDRNGCATNTCMQSLPPNC